jgi:5,6-dimethylbenzimidazole synthase
VSKPQVTTPDGRAPQFDEPFRARLRELLAWRRDVRHFRREPLPAGTLERLIEYASLAPSVGLSQPWRFVVIEDGGRRQAIRACFEACNADALRFQAPERAATYARLKLAGLEDAPGHVAVFADRETTQGHGLGRLTMPATLDYSVAMAVHTLWLAARAESIGVGWVSILDPVQVGAILDTPPTWSFIGYLCIGYPIEEQPKPELEREGWEGRRAAPDVTIYR